MNSFSNLQSTQSSSFKPKCQMPLHGFFMLNNSLTFFCFLDHQQKSTWSDDSVPFMLPYSIIADVFLNSSPTYSLCFILYKAECKCSLLVISQTQIFTVNRMSWGLTDTEISLQRETRRCWQPVSWAKWLPKHGWPLKQIVREWKQTGQRRPAGAMRHFITMETLWREDTGWCSGWYHSCSECKFYCVASILCATWKKLALTSLFGLFNLSLFTSWQTGNFCTALICLH